MADIRFDKDIIRKYGGLAPSRILKFFVEDDIFRVEHEKSSYSFIVFGRTGPTGKTWMSNGLRHYGFNAIELSEFIHPFVDYRDRENHVIKDAANRFIIIILNQYIGDYCNSSW